MWEETCLREREIERERKKERLKERDATKLLEHKMFSQPWIFHGKCARVWNWERERMTKLTVWKLHHLVGFHRLTWSNPSFLIGRKPSHVAAFVRPHWRGVKCPRQSTLCMFWSEKVVFLFFSFFAWSIMLSSWMEEHFAQFTWDQIYFFVLHFWSSLSLYYIFHFSSCNI